MQRCREKGFTIIEVMIVLAIAGLILLILFLAVPALQRNARNTRRKQDTQIILAYMQEYRSHHNRMPTSCNNTAHACWLRDPELSYYDNKGSENVVSFWNRGNSPHWDPNDELDPNDSNSRERISIRSYAKCDGPHLTGSGANSKNAAAQIVIEAGGNKGELLCFDF